MLTLDNLPCGQEAIIEKVSNSALSKRLYELGFYKGVRVKVISKAPLGDPIIIEIIGYRLAVRKATLKTIQIKMQHMNISLYNKFE